VEVAIFCPIGLFLSSNLGDGWNWLSKMKPGWTNRLLPDIRMKTDCNETNRRFYLKFCAEKVMYRSLALIFFITSIIPPSLKREKWNLGYGAVAMALCVYAWLYARMAKLEGVTSDPEPNRSISGRFLSIVTLVLLIWIIFTFWITFHYKADCFLKLAKRFVIGQ
jgi:hypothetical protein